MHSGGEACGSRCLGGAEQSRLGFGAGKSYDERRNKQNLQVNLVTRIPVLIVYGTATVNEENQIRFLTIFMVMTQNMRQHCSLVIPMPGRTPSRQGA